MENPAKETCGTLPQEAYLYLKKLANRDLTRIQALTHKIHLCFEQVNAKELDKEEFNNNTKILLQETYEYIQDLSNLNISFPTLFTNDQITVLLDLMHITTQLNLQFPNPEFYTEFANGQIGGAATIMQQQWAA